MTIFLRNRPAGVAATAAALALSALAALAGTVAPASASGPATTASPASAAAPGAAPGVLAEPAAPALPRPTGPYATGHDTLFLTDHGRADPWVPTAGARRLLVSLHYPARPGSGGATRPRTCRRRRRG